MNPRATLQIAVALASLVLARCANAPKPVKERARPSVLLVTLDTTRADTMGPAARGINTPAFNALASRGHLFSRAYTTVPETLPAHTSMMTGLLPAGHGVHENARRLPDRVRTIASELQAAGYSTGAFVSSFVLSRRFGLSRGFDVYDDEMDEKSNERGSKGTTDRALAYWATPSTKPRFVWVHYFDAHAPYEPPEPFKTRYAKAPYLGEVAAMDAQLGRLVEGVERCAGGPVVIIVVGDHGEGLGDHGEAQHGTLLYDATMRVPLVIAGPGVASEQSSSAVSTRRVFHTIRDFAGLESSLSLRAPTSKAEVVVAEAMKPFMNYGWQPQTMAVDGSVKVIQSGRLEAYDVASDPGETKDIAHEPGLSRAARDAVRDYPIPTSEAEDGPLSASEEQKLASLGYVSGRARATVRADAPRPVERVHLLPLIEKASGLFVAERYSEAVETLKQILVADPLNLDATLRLATSYSALGDTARAEDAFAKAVSLAPDSADVRVYRALHHAKGPRWEEAISVLEESVAKTRERLPALEALARIRERQGRLPDAIDLWRQVTEARSLSGPEHAHLASLAMSQGETEAAIGSFETARGLLGTRFENHLELGLLYFAARRFENARTSLDLVDSRSRDYPMALFKRAQIAVLLKEPDQKARIDIARKFADPSTRSLIAQERLFAGR